MRHIQRDRPQLFPPRGFRPGHIWAFLLMAALVFSGCTESPPSVKAGGPFFAAAEKAPSSKARVYFYWPPEETGQWTSLQAGLCEAPGVEIQVGGYDALLVEPGQQCLVAERVWMMESVNAFGSMRLATLDLNVEPGHTLFFRLEKGRGLLGIGMTLQPVEPATAALEMKNCRRMIPMTDAEIARTFAEGRPSAPAARPLPAAPPPSPVRPPVRPQP
jgi:hypothetical protein